MILLVGALQAFTVWDKKELLENGYSVTVECNKDNFVIEVVEKGDARVEQLYCKNVDRRNSICLVPMAIKCNEKRR